MCKHSRWMLLNRKVKNKKHIIILKDTRYCFQCKKIFKAKETISI